MRAGCTAAASDVSWKMRRGRPHIPVRVHPGRMSDHETLAGFVAASQRMVVLTGAGCSTESGIPDYRSPGGAWTRHKPIYFNSFVSSAEVRRFYWAGSFRGWPRFAAARPNAAHDALATLESRGRVRFL